MDAYLRSAVPIRHVKLGRRLHGRTSITLPQAALGVFISLTKLRVSDAITDDPKRLHILRTYRFHQSTHSSVYLSAFESFSRPAVRPFQSSTETPSYAILYLSYRMRFVKYDAPAETVISRFKYPG